MRRAGMALLLLANAACGSPRPVTPEGITVLRPPEIPPTPAAIQDAQERLLEAGTFAGPVDGEMTPATRVAIVQFQRARGIPISGVLDPPTMEALGLPPLNSYLEQMAEGAEQRTAQPEGPTAEDLLRGDVARELPQPPAGALDAQQEQARAILSEADARATAVLGAGELPPAERAEQAQVILREARARAFDLVLQAREARGWAPLPADLIGTLEDALAREALLVRGRDGRLGPDDAAAIRWVERSLGLPVTGRPGVPLLDALEIDPAPMFRP